jgi:hypothetical protein
LAGLEIVVASELPVNDTCGMSIPLLVDLTSNFAEASGVEVPIPTWALVIIVKNNKNTIKTCFMM